MSDSITGAAVSPGSISRPAQCVLALLRVAIGWHFLYEGATKLIDSHWTAGDYLRGSIGPFAGFFHSLAENAAWLKVVDQANIWALMAIGVCLMLGLFARAAAVGGVLLLGLYYAAYPPFFGPAGEGVAEGHYLLVNKNLVELFALCVVLALPVRQLGLDGLLALRRARRRKRLAAPAACTPDSASGSAWELPNIDPYGLSRRHALARLVGVPFMGGFVLAFLKKHGWQSHEENQLAARADARTGATIKVFDFSQTLKDLKGRPPQGQIGNLKVSRVILGGNLIGGWAHARDLIYVSKLIRAYHHRTKVFETLRLAEACGVNTLLTNPVLCGIIGDYWKSTGGKIQFISDCGGDDVIGQAKLSIDSGASACYIQGATADQLVAKGQMDVFGKFLDFVRKQGMPAGIGGHAIKTVETVGQAGLRPDFWMKTLHHHNYWSSRGKDECDNLWCDDPERTIAFMKARKEPWIAFKVLAAGALQPQDGFKYAFTHGADFVCVGMYDFQIIEDVNIAHDLLAGKIERQRAWYA
jgi:uncharacterized membrane protein YphA (DoxX/SURF4 family)